MASDKFTRVTGLLAKLVDSSGNLSVSATGEQIDAALTDLLVQLVGDGLAITGAKIASDTKASPATWSVTGTPSQWPIPGINAMPGIVSLKVTDGTDLTYTAGADTVLAGVALALSVAVKSGDTESTATLDIKAKAGLAVASLLPEVPVPGLGDAIDAAKDLVSVVAATLDEASIDVTKKAKENPSVTGGKIVGELKLGKIALQLTAKFKTNQTPDVTLDWPPQGVTASCSASDVLSALDIDATLPSELDLTLTSLRISYQHIAAADQLNKNDTVRVALVSPKDAATPDLQVVWSRGADAAWRTVARAGWSSLELSAIPIIGSHLPGKLDPLQLFVLTQDLPLADLQVLAGLKAFAGLENFGTPADKVSGAVITGGFYVAAIFDVTIEGLHLVHAPFNVPLYRFKAAPKGAPGGGGEKKPKPSEQANQTTTLPVQKSVGPVHLDDVALRYDSGALSIAIDVSILVSGLSLALIGLRLSYDVKSHQLSLGIDGLLMSFDEGSVDISGGLVRDTSGAATDWGGEALIKVGDAFALGAMAAFSDGDPKSLFVFAYDHQQLGGPPWLIITGIAAGFGYNRSFVVPTVDKVDAFPFIVLANELARGGSVSVKSTEDVKNLMGTIETYLSPADGNNFVTIGLTATSFGLVNSTALLTIVFGPSVEFVVLGSSSISVPSESPVAHAEIELVASIQPTAGIVAIDGLLAPGSYVLSSDCHLTGGFGYHMWFAGPHAGDFILTFGGYRAGYQRPAHYPDVPRLGFVWRVSDEVMVSGWNYFALMPSQVQAGGGLSVTLDAGPLHVWCTIQADFSLQWMPFHYDIAMSVDFGVSFRLDLWICTITISIDISADLHIWGPDFSGHADVHLWFVSFGVSLGADASQDKPQVSWDQFLGSLVVPPAPPKQKKSAPMLQASLLALGGGETVTTSPHQPVQIVKVAGLSGTDGTWIGDPAKAVVSIVTSLPTATAEVNKTAVLAGQTIVIKASAIKDAPQIDPVLSVTITAGDNGDAALWGPQTIVSQVSTALWGPGTATGTPPQLTPGITGLQLVPVIVKPDALPPIEQTILLVSDATPIAVTWAPSHVPAPQSFDWDRQNPYTTIKPDSIKSALAGLVTAGYLAQAALDGIDPSFVTADQPCFMAHPVLCPLGAEQYSEAQS
jgi:hypothetical protein